MKAPRRFVARDGSLADSVLEIDSQIESGDFEQEVLLSGAAWARLVREAQDKLEDVAVDQRVERSAAKLQASNASQLAATVREQAAELVSLRSELQAARLAHVHCEWAFSDAPDSEISAAALELRSRVVDRAELVELREFKARKIARNVDGSEYTFSAIAPSIEAFLGQNDGKGGERDCHVRFLLDDGAGCVIDFKKARDVAHETLSKIDAALFVPEKKPKKARGKKMFCGTCNAETKHDGNDECVVCANPEPEFEPVPPPRKPEQTELEQAISGAAS